MGIGRWTELPGQGVIGIRRGGTNPAKEAGGLMMKRRAAWVLCC